MGPSSRRTSERRAAAAKPSAPTPKQAIARMRSSLVSINEGDPSQPIGSGVIVRGSNEDDGIVATALHVVRDVAAADLQIGFPVPPSEQARGGLTMLGATVIETDEGNDLALLKMDHVAPFTEGVPHPSGGQYYATVAELEAERPEDGEDVMISGFPLGYRYVLNSSGIIACSWGDQSFHEVLLDRDTEFTADVTLDRYLVDVNVNPGNSGGPCYRITDQRVLGICEALKLIEVDVVDNGPDVEVAPGDVDEGAQRAVFQKADITFVVPAKYVIALLETV
jgi:S1-C subfamily serine protease